MLLDAAPGEDVRALARREPAGEPPQREGGDAGDRLHALGPPRRDAAAHAVEPDGPLGDVVGIDEALGDHDVDQAEEQGEVGAGRGLHVQALPVVGEPRGRRAPRVDDDEPAGRLGAREVPDERRHRLGDVRAEEEDRGCPVEVLERERQAPVDAERAVAGGRRRRHAVPAVVVDAAGAEREPGELAEQVGLLVREAAAAEHADRVGAVGRADAAQRRRDQVERLVPARLVERAVGAPHERGAEAGGCAEQLRRGPALLAQPTAIRREVAAGDRHGRGRGIRGIRRGEGHRALQGAVRAVRGGGTGHLVSIQILWAPRRPERTYTT